mmetsp:Transcript_55089/g.101991  ORF Transcript_55089/g.101991 Transcript_55089/m.101991 type:complete len:108 (+) Transcript_55089:67-390(+)
MWRFIIAPLLLAGTSSALAVAGNASREQWSTSLAPGLAARIVISSGSGDGSGPATAAEAVEALTYQVANEGLRGEPLKAFLSKYGVNPQAKLVAPQLITDPSEWAGA